jgi:hypothetical protein
MFEGLFNMIICSSSNSMGVLEIVSVRLIVIL